MTLKVDEKADALYLRLDDSKIIESEEVSPGGSQQVTYDRMIACYERIQDPSDSVRARNHYIFSSIHRKPFNPYQLSHR